MPKTHQKSPPKSHPLPVRKAHLHRHHAHHGPLRLPRWQLQVVYWSFGLLSASGLLWLAIHGLALMDAPQDHDGLPLPTPAKAWAMRLHAASALAAFLALGSLLPVHVRIGWLRHRNRASGTVNLLSFSLLALTGYALWYASEGFWKEWSTWVHWGFGVAMPLALVAHVILGRLSRPSL